ncbi:hypothetical protein P153DRAFT_353260 [Dothidotthia symphoricarpi CBS 119687]|uniref:Uncharacterized protein n=1 Tax=Dothidotthia symphoricarpi CBS 119687 TaxID=1392245 RepID=A0A6A6AU25_9PLEO|nr:uncharacterized protein P153DRAFT_353260 [Dothidotthia symphoricarpi CBS 119687]KAF2134051.1 hypothetical protein P153DRAFT_353260 [Dothidotthia symphoricarpi CBS 119687]
MSDLPDAPDSDMESACSDEMQPRSPLTRDKMREGHARWVTEIHEKQEFKILVSMVKQPATLPENAVKHLAELSLQCKADDGLGDHCYYTACSFLEVVALTMPDQQHDLLAFIHQLRATTLTDPVTGEAILYDGVVWRDLPTFGYTIADELGSFSGAEDDCTIEEVQRWENLIAFFAQLDASTSDPELDFSNTWALTALTWAFEDPASTRPTDITLRLACLWYIFDADKLWLKTQSRQFDNYSLESWNCWKQCLVNWQSAFADPRTRLLIDGALAQIKRVEASA